MHATVSFIGTGNMGSALIKGLSGVESVTLVGVDVDREKLNVLCAECSIMGAPTMHEAVSKADYVVLCVKPQVMKAVLEDVRPALTPDKCLVSIAAGVTQAQLSEWSGNVCPVVRVMPNTPALVNGGVSAVCLDDPRLTPENKDMVRNIFSTVGSVHVLEEKAFQSVRPEEISALVRDSGALDRTRQLAHEYANRAKACLNGGGAHNEFGRALAAVPDFILDRER